MKNEILLKKLFEDPPLAFKKAKRFDVLVICAGSFPSYGLLVTILKNLFPTLQDIYFTLVEPRKDKTDVIEKAYPAGNFEIYNITLGDFLKNTNGRRFDIIYFEHPDMRILPIFLNKLFYMFLKTASLRESIAYLTVVCKEEALLIAVNMSKNENRQLFLLLKLCFNIRPVIFNGSYLKKTLFEPYSNGLYAKISVNNLKQNMQKNAEMIKKSDRYLSVVIMLSLFVFYKNFISEHSLFAVIFLVVLILCLVFFYSPGRKGMFFMIIFMIFQVVFFCHFSI